MFKMAQDEFFGILPYIETQLKNMAYNKAATTGFGPKMGKFLDEAYMAHQEVKATKAGKFFQGMKEMPVGPLGNDLVRGAGVIADGALTGGQMVRNRAMRGHDSLRAKAKSVFKKRFNLMKNSDGLLVNALKKLLKVR